MSHWLPPYRIVSASPFFSCFCTFTTPFLRKGLYSRYRHSFEICYANAGALCQRNHASRIQLLTRLNARARARARALCHASISMQHRVYIYIFFGSRQSALLLTGVIIIHDYFTSWLSTPWCWFVGSIAGYALGSRIAALQSHGRGQILCMHDLCDVCGEVMHSSFSSVLFQINQTISMGNLILLFRFHGSEKWCFCVCGKATWLKSVLVFLPWRNHRFQLNYE